MKTNRSRWIGFAMIAIGLLANHWLLALLFSSDGSLGLYSKGVIWCFQLVITGTGLLVVFRKTRIIVNLGLMVAVMAITLFVFDLAARALLKDKLYYRPEERFKNRWPPLHDLSKFETNIDFTSEVFGDLAAMSGLDDAREVHTTEFKTDSYGYRNSLWNDSTPVDIIILGDSFGSGVGVTQTKTWDYILTDKYGLKTYNLSIPGYNLWTELLCLKVELPRIQTADSALVLWAVFAGNDLDTPYGKNLDPFPLAGLVERVKVSLGTFKRRSPILQLLGRIGYESKGIVGKAVLARRLPDSTDLLFYNPYIRPIERPYEEVIGHENYDKMKRAMEDMRVYADSCGLKVAVLLIPGKEEIYHWVLKGDQPWSGMAEPSGFSLAMSELCDSLGFNYLDMKPYFRKQAERLFDDSGELLYWRDDTHWNENGHALAAALVFEHLLREKQKILH